LLAFTFNLYRYNLAGDRAMAKNVQASLEYTTLHSVAAVSEVHYDPEPTDTVIEEDREFVRSYYEMPDEEVDPARMSPWLLRIELNREMMVGLYERKLFGGSVETSHVAIGQETTTQSFFFSQTPHRLLVQDKLLDPVVTYSA
jgi:hypothetical protein